MKAISLWLLGILLCQCASAQVYSVSGKITDHDDLHLVNAKVFLDNRSDSTVTDNFGRFIFSNLTNGQYNLRVQVKNYHEYRSVIKVNGEDVVKNIKLQLLVHQLNEVTINDKRIIEQRKEQSLNITTVKDDFIQRYLGGSLMQSLERLPGIKTIGIGSGQSKPLIRGLGFNRVVVVDKGVKHEGQQWGTDHGLEIDQFSVGEANLLKGAASFIYGSDAIGGAIDLKPLPLPQTNTLGGEVNLIGKSNNKLFGNSLNLYGRNKNWFFDSRFTYQDYADYRVPTEQVFVYDYAVKLYRNHLRNTAGKETGLHFSGGYVNEKLRSIFHISNTYSRSGFFANAHGLEPRRVDEIAHDASARDILLPKQQVNHFKIVNKTSFTSGHHQFSFDLGFQQNFRQEFNDYVNHGYMPAIYPNNLGIPINLEREFDKVVFSLNARDEFHLNRHRLTIGFNGEYQDNQINGWSFLVPAFKQKTAGLFVLDQLKFNDEFILTGGLRYDYGNINLFEYKDWFASVDQQNGTSLNLVRADAFTRNFNSLVWSLGLNFNKDKFEFKANAGKSFRMPIAKELAANGVNYHYFSYERGNSNLNPEQSYQLDLGFGYRDKKLTIQLSPFFNYFPNYIYLNPTADHDYYYGAGNQVFQYEQSRVMRYGGEFQLNYQLPYNLSTEFLVEYLYAEQLSGNKKGYTLPFSPPPSALLNVTWQPKLSSRLQNSYLSIDYRLTATQNNIVPPEKKSPGYNLINIQVGTHINLYKQPVIISLQAQNVLNTKYLNHTSFYRLIELPETGRNFIVSLKIPFQIKSSINKIN